MIVEAKYLWVFSSGNYKTLWMCINKGSNLNYKFNLARKGLKIYLFFGREEETEELFKVRSQKS
jgi:hypothetical protein